MAFNGLVFLRHDPLLTAASAVIGACACLCVLKLRSRLRFSRASARLAWVVLGGAVLGIGAWAAESVQLAGFSAEGPVGFDTAPLLGSLLLSVCGSVAALTFGWSRRGGMRALIGGLTLTATFAAMRFLAVTAYQAHLHATWQPILLCLGNGVSAATAVAAFRLSDGRSSRSQTVAALLMMSSLWSIEIFSSAAATLTPHGGPALSADLLGPGVVTFMAVMIAVVAMFGAFGAAHIDDLSSRTALQRTRRLADAAREGILVVSESGMILDVNAAAAALAGCEVDQLLGRPLDALLQLPSRPAPGAVIEGLLHASSGERIPVHAHAQPLHDRDDRDEPTSVFVVRDLREQRAVEDRVRFLTENDTLTGLPNRAALRRWVSERMPRNTLLFYVRVVNHAETNSLFGHAVGDAVLQKLAERLQRYVDHPVEDYECLAARLGGAEFAFAATGPTRPEDPFPRTFLKALGRVMVVDGQAIEPVLRMGVASAPLDCDTEEDLFRHAEVALDRATREDGVDGVTYFRQDLQDDLVARRSLIHELKIGIAENQLVVHYQPQAAAEDGRLCGFEALVRWMHPVHGFMPPDSFIPAAEQSGLIVPLGEAVLRRACADAVSWPAPVPVAVNLSPLQIGQTDLPRLVHEVLLETGLPPSRLELEITESALFRDFQRALDTLRRIKGLGVKVAMDDFGTGFSSLSTLQSFPFDKIKIDKSFVGARGDRSTVLVKAVLGIGRGLDIPVVAEGVETADQMAFLREEGCAVVQGYFIGKPAPIAAHAAMFRALTGEAAEPAADARRPRPYAA